MMLVWQLSNLLKLVHTFRIPIQMWIAGCLCGLVFLSLSTDHLAPSLVLHQWIMTSWLAVEHIRNVSWMFIRHGVKTWDGGERVCQAHFMKDAVHDRLDNQQNGFVYDDYINLRFIQFLFI